MMKKLSVNEIRRMWINFFVEKNHYFLEPVSLVPVDDSSLLWINSGVATLKPYFDGRKLPPALRLVNSQKSIRTNDIENVGITARHQTMFEMLGNFSLGDYFKKEAINMAWELLTSPKWFAMNKDLLYITVYEEDEETYQLWTKEIGIATDHIFKGTKKTNFWDIGQGPCGPNTEIFFDRGEKWDEKKIGAKLLKDDIENDRYIEIWNIVFSQYNNEGNNVYSDLPKKNIDTGAGLERLASIFQDSPTNFETDIFLPIIKQIEGMCDKNYKYNIKNYFNEEIEQTKINTAFKVIADHIRAITFAISDGVLPDNKDRGYIIRRLIRRSSVYAKKIGIIEPFLYKLVDEVVLIMEEFYPYIREKATFVKNIIKNEETKFLQTLSKGYDFLQTLIKSKTEIDAKNALLLFESYGFPIELTSEIAEENKVKIDISGFKKLLEQAKDLSRSARKIDHAWNKQSLILSNLDVESEFVGYDVDECKASINFMFIDENPLKKASNEIVFLSLSKTPFYAEKGGQAADNGFLIDCFGNKHEVIDVQQGPNKQHIHKVQINGELKLGDQIHAQINQEKRYYTMKHHSGTHILQSAIREILGENATQQGSFNNEDELRLDISFNRMPTQTEINNIHNVLEKYIKDATPREIIFCSLDEAVSKYQALALFTEKYGEKVRLIKFGSYSAELCGGTHVMNTKDIEDLFITNIESKGSGIYRFYAVASQTKVNHFLEEQFLKQKSEIKPIAEKYNKYKEINPNKDIQSKLEEINSIELNKENLANIKILVNNLKNEFKLYQKKIENKLSEQKLEAFKKVEPIKKSDIKEIVLNTDDLEIHDMKILSDYFQNQYKSLIVKLINNRTKIYIVSVSTDIAHLHKAIEIFKQTKEFEVKGGGNDTFAQGKIL